MAEPEFRIFTRDSLIFLGLVAVGFGVSFWFAGLLLPFLLIGGFAGLLLTLAAMRIRFSSARSAGNYLLLANVLIFVFAQHLMSERNPEAVQDALWAGIVQYIAGYAVARYTALWIAFGGSSGNDGGADEDDAR